jgi:F-type H+-transporting ATPase subunit delta
VSGESVAVRYARALYEAASESGRGRETAADMLALRKILSDVPGVKGYCLDERPNRDSDVVFVETAFAPYVGGLTRRMLRAAAENGRIGAVPLIPEAYRTVSESGSGKLTVVLETSFEPDAELLRLVNERMRKRTALDVDLRSRVVPSLLAGLRVVWGNRVIDLSAAGRLRSMRSLITSD